MFKRKNPAELQAQLQQMKGGSSYANADDKLWKPTKDSSGNATAVIRFLPAKGEMASPFEKMINHYFKKGGKTYYANCTSTKGDYESCPVCEHLKANDSYNSNKPEYDLLKRKTQYWANILVVKDPAKPENEGKVFKFRFGVKLMEKITAMAQVDESLGEVAVDVTCVFGGANLVLKLKQQGGFDNYDDSKFSGVSEIANINDEKFQAFLEAEMTDLTEITSADKFDTYAKNKEKFNKVMGTSAMGGAAASAASIADDIDNQLNSFDKEMAEFNSGGNDATTKALEADLDQAFNSTPAASSGKGDELDDLLNDL